MATKREKEPKDQGSKDERDPGRKEETGSLTSYVYSSRSSSFGVKNFRHVFVEANRHILMEIGYSEDKTRLVKILRSVEWDPTFWSLNDEIVTWFNSDDDTIKQKIDYLKKSIADKEKRIISTRMNMRVKNRERGCFNPALEVFPSLVKPPNPEEPFSDIFQTATDTICKTMMQLNDAKIENLENEFKLASMNEKLEQLKGDMKSFQERSKRLDVNSHLMAVEMQNSMLNELLTLILQEIKKTSSDLENLKSADTNVLLKIIKEANDLNFKVINDCYPQKSTTSQLLWCPHDVKHMSLEDFLSLSKPDKEQLDVAIEWKKLKKNVKEIGYTWDQLARVKRKVEMIEARKVSGNFGTIQYFTEIEANRENRDSIRNEGSKML